MNKRHFRHGELRIDLKQVSDVPGKSKAHMRTYVVQFTTGLAAAHRQMLEEAQVREFGPELNSDCLTCRMGPDLAHELRDATRYPMIHAITPFQAEWKLFLPKTGDGTHIAIHIVTFAAFEKKVASLAQQLGGEGVFFSPNIKAVTVRSFPRAKLLNLAANDYVVCISAQSPARSHDLRSLGALGVKNQYGKPTAGTTQPIPDPPPTNNVRLDGTGQSIAVADSGLDTGVANNTLSPAFNYHRVTGQGYAPRAVVGQWSDMDGHGTHVSGIVVGQQDAGKGVAPAAALRFQGVGTDQWSDAKNDFTLDLTALPVMLPDAYNAPNNARVHNNSWGGTPDYNNNAKIMDDFTADDAHADFTIVVSAGNEGDKDDSGNKLPDGQERPKSISSPGTAKNVITVGACGNDISWSWQAPGLINPAPPVSKNNIASFSSRGPTADGRIKPDVVAPGDAILSAKSSELDIRRVATWTAEGVYTNPIYVYASGTSMAAPGVAGCAALIRQWLTNQVDVNRRSAGSPSSALIKALLINRAIKVVNGSNAWGGWGSPQQGWGRVNVSEIVDPSNSINIWWADEGTALQQGNYVEYTFSIPKPGLFESQQLLKITLVWRDPAPAAPDTASTVTTPKLQNNLDLELLGPAPASSRYVGNKLNSSRSSSIPVGPAEPYDQLNNVECIIIDPKVTTLTPGTYRLRVHGGRITKPTITTASQKYALAISGFKLSSVQVGAVVQTPTLRVDEAHGEYGVPTTLSAVLPPAVGKPAPNNLPITFAVNGTALPTVNTDNSGTGLAQTQYTCPAPGNYAITAQWAGDADYPAATGSATLTVTRAVTALAVANPAAVDYGGVVQIVATLTKSGLPVQGEKVGFLITGTGETLSALTDAHGNATISWSAFMAGTRNVLCSFEGSALHMSAPEQMATITVNTPDGLHVMDCSAIQGSTVILTATLGPAAAGKQVELLLNDVVIATELTDDDGQITSFYDVTAPVGPQALVARYTGDPPNSQEPVTAAATLTVSQFGLNPPAATCYTPVQLTASTNPAIPGLPVTFKIGPTEMPQAVTNVGGQAQITHTFDVSGPHDITVTLNIPRTLPPPPEQQMQVAVARAASTLTLLSANSGGALNTLMGLAAVMTPAIAGLNVSFLVNGAEIPNSPFQTDETGAVQAPYIPTQVGRFSLQARFAGNNSIQGVNSAIGSLTIEKVD